MDVDVKTFLIDFKSRLKGAKDAIATMQKLDAVIATTGKDAQKSFGRINDASSILSTKTNIIGSRGGKQLTQMTQVVQNTAGEFKKLTYQQENVKGKMVLVKDSVKVANVATKDFNKSTMSLGDNFKKLAGRAALTIPIWLALRTVVMGLFRTIGDGLKYWVEIDKEMMRVSMTMGDVSGKGDVLESVFEKANKMSKETGKSMNEIIKSFYQFKTLGLSVTDSMAGMNAVTKGSIALMANLDSLALALSQSYKILGGTMDKNIDTEGLMEANLGKILLLFHENAFVTDELTGAVNRFLPTAATMNFTFDETIALMATLHSAAIKNTRAGRLMRTSVAQLSGNLGKVGDLLGLKVNPAMERTPEILNRVLIKLRELSKTDVATFQEAMQVFGGVRSKEAARAVLAIFDTYQKNLELTRMSSERARRAFNQQYKENLDSLNVQLARLKTLKTEWGRTFVTGLLGAEEFGGAIKNLNNFLSNTVRVAETLGNTLNMITLPALAALLGFLVAGPAGAAVGLISGVLGEAQAEGYRGATKFQKDRIKTMDTDVDSINKVFRGSGDIEEMQDQYYKLTQDKEHRKKLIQGGLSKAAIQAQADYIYDVLIKTIGGKDPIVLPGIVMPTEAVVEVLDDATKNTIKSYRESLKYMQLEIQGYDKMSIAQEKLYDTAQKMVDVYNDREVGEGQELIALTAQEAILAVMTGDYEKIKSLIINKAEYQKEILKIEKEIAAVAKEAAAEMLEYSQELKKAFQDSFKSLIENKSGMDDFLNTMGTTIREQITGAFSEAFTTEFFKVTEMGGIFGGAMSDISDIFNKDTLGGSIYQASKKGAAVLYDKILRAHLLGAEAMGQATGNAVTASAGATGLAGLNTASSYLGFMKNPMYMTSTPNKVGVKTSGASAGQAKTSGMVPGPTWGQGIGAAMGVGTSAYSAYQTGGIGGALMAGTGTAALAATQLGMGFGTGGIFAAGTTSAAGITTGAGALAGLGAILPVLGIALAIGSMFIKKTPPKWSQEDTKESTNQIASRIDVTNQELAWVNRNLVAMRNELTYIMQRSYYFREQGTNELFSIDSRRGVS